MSIWLYLAFFCFVLVVLATDAAMLGRRGRSIHIYEALAWSFFWLSAGLGFTVFVYYAYENRWLDIGTATGLGGREAAYQYLTAFFVQEFFTVDNMVVFTLVFLHFELRETARRRVLFWGILGAILLRTLMISAGAASLYYLDWVAYAFGAILILSAAKVIVSRRRYEEPDERLVARIAARVLPLAEHGDDGSFFVVEDGRRRFTPLFVVLLLILSADLFFAVESIPAVLAVAQHPFLVLTSNVFAMVGLRAAYFGVSGIIQRFRYMQVSLAILLAGLGVKMLLHNQFRLSADITMLAVFALLATGIVASLGPLNTVIERVGESVGSFAQMGLRQARKVVILVFGSSVILVGVVMLVTPGPAFVVIPAGLAILATEFVWARRLLARIKTQGLDPVAARIPALRRFMDWCADVWARLRGHRK